MREKGSITVFLCIVLSIIIALTGVFVDLARIYAADAEADQALKSSVKSALAEYNSTLKDLYGLFALSKNDASEIEAELTRYLDLSLTVEGNEKNLLDLYGFKIEQVNAVMGENLADSDVLSNQILNYMQLRAPKELVEVFGEKMGIFKTLPQSTKALEKKMEADKNLEELEDVKTKLAQEITKINKFKSDSSYLDEASISIDNAFAYISRAEQIASDYKTKSGSATSELKGDSLPQLAMAIKGDIEKNIKLLNRENYAALKQKLSANRSALNSIRSALQKQPPDQGTITQALNSYSYIDGFSVAKEKTKANDPRDAYRRSIASNNSENELKVPADQAEKIVRDFNAKKDSLSSEKKDSPGEAFGFNEKKGDFTDKTVKDAKNFLEPVAHAMGELQGNLYTGEYILGTFKHFLSDKQNELDLRNNPKKDRDTFFKKGEIEYILTGNPDENKSLINVKSRLILMRALLNFVYLYTDVEKCEEALVAATAIAGWTGFGIPVVQAGIMLGWATAEASYDVKRLLEGKNTPLFKTRDTWIVSLDGAARGDAGYEEKKGVVWMGYTDYLRILLLQTSKEHKLRRLQNLIELNMKQKDDGFALAGQYTFISAEAEVSMKYVFLTSIIMPNRLKELSRHALKIKAEYRY